MKGVPWKNCSCDDLAAQFWAKTAWDGDCLIWQGALEKRGYGNIRIHDRCYKAHRLAWQMVWGPISDDLYVLHRCDNRRCVRPDHLFLGTHTDNIRDGVRKGRMLRGDASGHAILTFWQVLYIKEQLHCQRDYRDVAHELGVHPATIHNIARGANWAWLSYVLTSQGLSFESRLSSQTTNLS